MRPVLHRDFMPLVIGAPRSGFSLCISVLNNICPLFPDFPSKGGVRQGMLGKFIQALDRYIADEITIAFEEAGKGEDLVYNDNFRIMTGGPKWLDPSQPDTAVVRKYIGARGCGDFTLLVRHPRAVLDNDAVVHSHEKPSRWAKETAYDAYVRYATIRNPIAILNSSCHSLNALTSEYIQKFCGDAFDQNQVRLDLAENKLSNMVFFEGLVDFLIGYFQDFCPVRDRYHVMKWEDLIQTPVETIQALGRAGYLEVSEATARRIWANLSRVNLTGAHKHNFRPWSGRIDDWRDYLTPHHMAMMKEKGIFELVTELGFDRPAEIRPQDYTPFQQRVAAAIDAGQPIDRTEDRDLFGFAFNKSNLRSEAFGFRSGEWRRHTRIERSCFTDPALEAQAWDRAETAAERVNGLLEEVLAHPFHHRAEAEAVVADIERRYGTGDDAFASRVREGVRTGRRLIDWFWRPAVIDAP
jgi:hypothetical protein